MQYKIALAGSSKYTVMMAEILQNDARFKICYTLSPTPKLIGREQILTENPLHLWSQKEKIATFLVEKKIDEALHEQLSQMQEIDFLLVVDFGYLIPSWLLQLPKIAPLNIHPSLLPKWRGSSPGQFSLLFRGLNQEEQNSAVTLMIMSEGLDQGPIIAQLPFQLEENWTQNEYYQHAFTLMAAKLGDLIDSFAENRIKSQAQTSESPTMTARRLTKEDGFVTWQDLQQLMATNLEKVIPLRRDKQLLNDLLADNAICKDKADQIKLIINASKAFSPWPGLWTTVHTNKGEKRMKIFSCHANKNQLVLDQVQIEGKAACLFNEGKNALI
jgi:methionyl-tRNA formyltransferase